MSARKTPHKPGPPHPSWSCQLCSLPCLPLPSHACLWCPSSCLPLPSHVFGVSHPVCPSPPMSLVFLTPFASPIPCLWCPSLCLPLPFHVFGVPHPVCLSHPMSFVHPLLCLPTLLYLHVSQPTHLHCMVSADLSRILRHLVNYSDHLRFLGN